MQTFLFAAIVIGMTTPPAVAADTQSQFGPSNPFYAPSTLPYQAPPFDKIKDDDYIPAMDAGMAEEQKEMEAIANNPAPPTFENTIVAMEKSGRLLRRVQGAFFTVVSANENPTLQKVSASRRSTTSESRSTSIQSPCGWSSTTMTSLCMPEPN